MSEQPLTFNQTDDVDKKSLAKMLDMSPRRIDNEMAKGLPHYKYSARMVRFRPCEVRQWISENYKLQRRKTFTRFPPLRQCCLPVEDESQTKHQHPLD
jgi:hypothetical protein